MTTPDASAAGTRRCELSDGRVLTVRPVTPADTTELRELYADLSEEDRRRRFFSYFRPPNSFFETKTAADDPHRYGLVASVPDDGIVGEAGYVMLPNGNAELAVTITKAWRGWLGHYVLDALIEAAAAHGIPNLEAEILRENQPMLALVQARGYAARSEDRGSVRVVIGTHGPTPTWPERHDRPRVLVEARGGTWRAGAEAQAAGLDVMVCPGPIRGSGRSSCPVLEGKPCPLAETADVVVFALDPHAPDTAPILAAHVSDRAEGCLAVDVAADDARGVPVPVGTVRFPRDMPVHQIVATLRQLAGPEPEPEGLQ